MLRFTLIAALLPACIVDNAPEEIEPPAPIARERAAREPAAPRVRAEPPPQIEPDLETPSEDVEPGPSECPDGEPESVLLELEPLEVIELRAPDAFVRPGLRHEWIVTQRPPGSHAQPVEAFFALSDPQHGGPADDLLSPDAFFFADVVGDYRVALRVVGSGCSVGVLTVELRARPTRPLYAELVWHTPGDPDPSDAEGVDLDLHLLHPDGEWFEAPEDCFVENRSAVWEESWAHLQLSDLNGEGPEVVTLTRPALASDIEGPYLIGVHHYAPLGGRRPTRWGPTAATLRIYAHGQRVLETQHVFEAEGAFWVAAAVAWTEEGVEAEALEP